MTADKIGVVFGNQVSRAYRLGAEAQMRDGNRAGFFRVVNEIALGVQIGRFADNFNGVFIGADRAVAAQAVKHGLKVSACASVR